MMTAPAQESPKTASAHPVPTGLAKGTDVLTLKGICPVEALRGGDRIITRSGTRKLRNVSDLGAGYFLEFDTPEVVLLAEGQVHSDTGLPFAA